MPLYKSRSAFTLIEIIVAVVILVILSTGAFVGYSGYVSSSRDSKRVADLSGIYSGLATYAAKHSELPIPSESIEITHLDSVIGRQWYAGKQVLSDIGLTKGGRDPKNNISYTYNIDVTKQKGQLLGYFESDANANILTLDSMVPAVRALSYEDLNPTTTGTKLGIFVMTGSHTPIQDIWTGSLVLDTLTLLGGLVIGSCAGDGSDTLSVTGDTVTQISNCYALSKPLGRWAIPSDPRNIFASGSIWTKNWSANACPTSGLSVIMLNPGIDTIPATLAANTIYILNPGEYPVTRASTTSGSPCSAIIGKDHEDPISQLISYSWSTNISSLFTGNGNNLIVSNLTLSGSQIGGTTGNGMQLSINNSTVGNIHAVGNSSNGIFCSGCTNSSFEDIITHSNTGNGFNGGEGCYPSFVNSTVSQLRSFNNGGAGVYLGRVCAGWGNAFGNTRLDKLTLYNNVTGFMFYGNGNSYSSANISNIRSFNNTNDGLYLYAISGTSFSNIVSFNNGGKGIHSPDSYSNFWNYWQNILSNIVTFNNADSGVYGSREYHTAQSNMYSYNNGGYGLGYNYSTYPRAFNIMKTFSNGAASGLWWGGFGATGDFTGTGFLTGTHDTTGTYDSSWAIAPEVAGWDTNIKGRQTGVSLGENPSFTFWSNIPLQLSTYQADGCAALAAPRCSPAIWPSWTYDTTKRVGEW